MKRIRVCSEKGTFSTSVSFTRLPHHSMWATDTGGGGGMGVALTYRNDPRKSLHKPILPTNVSVLKPRSERRDMPYVN